MSTSSQELLLQKDFPGFSVSLEYYKIGPSVGVSYGFATHADKNRTEFGPLIYLVLLLWIVSHFKVTLKCHFKDTMT